MKPAGEGILAQASMGIRVANQRVRGRPGRLGPASTPNAFTTVTSLLALANDKWCAKRIYIAQGRRYSVSLLRPRS